MRRGASLLLAIAALLVGITWAVSSPVGSSPDDDFHLTNIWCPPPLGSSGCEVVTAADGTRGVVVPTLVAAPQKCFAFRSFVSAECQGRLSSETTRVSLRINDGLYPGPYYSFMHLFVGPDVARSVLVMRAVNVAVAVSLLSALACLATASGRRLLTYGLLGSIVPLGVFVVASVNPSSWAFVGATITWFAVHQMVSAETRQRVLGLTALYVVGAGMAVVSRGDAAAFVLVLTVAAVTVHGRAALARPARLIVPGLMSVLGLVVLMLVRQTDALATGLGPVDATRSGLGVLLSNVTQIPSYLLGIFGYPYGAEFPDGTKVGGLGWLDTEMPAITVVGAAVVVCGMLFVGLGVLTAQKGAGYALLALTMVGLPLVVLQMSLNVVGENVQPRYVLPLLPALLATSMLGRQPTSSLRLRGGQAVVAFVLLSAAHAAALQANLRRYITGAEQGGIDLGEGAEWWWPNLPSPMLVWFVGSAAFVLLAASVLVVSTGPEGEEPRRLQAATRARRHALPTTRATRAAGGGGGTRSEAPPMVSG
jgi:hypothetical protein